MPKVGRPKRSHDVEWTCRHCGKKTISPEWFLRGGERGQFCSRACYNAGGRRHAFPEYRIQPTEKVCEECSTIFLVGGMGRPRRQQQFCSLSCSDKAKWRLGQYQPRKNVGWRNKALDATIHPTSLDLAWAAGIFEGEGYASPNIVAHTAMVNVTQKDRWILDRLQKLFGGSVRTTKTKYPAYPHLPTRWGTYFIWGISGLRARGFLMTIYLFLSPRKRAQARAALGK